MGDDRAAAERALAAYAEHPRGTSPSRIEKMLGSLAIAFPAGRLSDDEAKLRLKIYTTGLVDVDVDLLREAVSNLILTSTFFPTVAEIRRAAGRLPAPARTVRAWRLRQLLRAASSTAVPDPGGPARQRRVEATVARVPARAGAAVRTTSEPTVDDYLAHGLTEEEARAALADRERMLKRPGRAPSAGAAVDIAA